MANTETELEKTPEETPLNKFLGEAIVECSAILAGVSTKPISKWGVDFYANMMHHIDVVRQVEGNDFGLIAIQTAALEKARELDRDALAAKLNKVKNNTGHGDQEEESEENLESDIGENKYQQSVEKEIKHTWAGLLAELAVLDLLRSMHVARDLMLIDISQPGSENATILGDFNRFGRADFVFFLGEDGKWVGIQVKSFKGKGVVVVDPDNAEAVAALQADLKDLRQTVPNQREIHIPVGKDDFAKVVNTYYDKPLETKKLLYILVGSGAIGPDSGRLWDSHVAYGAMELIRRVIKGEVGYGKVEEGEVVEVVK